MRGILFFFSVLSLCMQLTSCTGGVVVQPKYKSITEAVYASGTIYARDEYKVYALAEGSIMNRWKEAGDSVEAGTLIYTLQADASDAKLQAARTAYSLSQANRRENSPQLQELRMKIQAVETQLANERVQEERYRNMAEGGALPVAEYDRIKTQRQLSEKNLQALRENDRRLNDQLRLEEQNALAQQTAAGQDASNFRIESRMRGVLYETYKEPGEAIRRNDLLALIGSGEDQYIKLQVDQQDITRIMIGQSVVVKTDMNDTAVFRATVKKIYRTMNPADQTFAVEAEFAPGYKLPFIHTTVEANIILQTKEKALTLPRQAIDAEGYVQLKTWNGVKKVKVTTGVMNLEEAEIIAGVKTQDEIIIPE